MSATIHRLVLEPVDGNGAVIDFLPGQYVHLGIPGSDQRRSYSFANAPHAAERMEFYIKVLERGVMSEYVTRSARLGDEVLVTTVDGAQKVGKLTGAQNQGTPVTPDQVCDSS